MEQPFDLTLIWAGIIAFGVMMYVLMDGFDLGQGHRERGRHQNPEGRRMDDGKSRPLRSALTGNYRFRKDYPYASSPQASCRHCRSSRHPEK